MQEFDSPRQLNQLLSMSKLIDCILKSNWRVFLAIAILGFAVYAVILPTPFKTMDDYLSIIDNPNIKNISNIGSLFKSSFFGVNAYYRPLVNVSFMMEYHLFGLNSFYYNLTNVILHILTSMCVFVIVDALLRNRKSALAAAALFVLHPIQWEGVSNIPGRSILLCALFFSLAFMCFLNTQQEGKGKFVAYLMTIIFFVLSLLSKESALMFPFVCVFYLYVYGDKKRTPELSLWAPVVPFFVLTGCYVFLRRSLGIVKILEWTSIQETILSVCTFLKSCLIFGFHLVWPVDLYYDRSLLIFSDFADMGLWLTLAAWGIILAGLIINWQRISLPMRFFLGWIVINLATVSQIVPVKVSWDRISMADHFLYLPSIGIFAVAVHMFRFLLKKLEKSDVISPPIIQCIVLGIYVFFFVTTVQQNIYASQQVAMFKRSLEHNPGNIRVLNALATAQAIEHQYEDAKANYRKIIRMQPFNIKAQIGFGKVLCDQEKYWEGIQAYENIQNPGSMADLLSENLELAYKNLIDRYEDRISREPNNAELHYSLAVMYGKRDRVEESIDEYEYALRINPIYGNALLNLASSYANLEQWDMAIQYYQQVIDADGADDQLKQTANELIIAINQKMK